jgi:hypothetical protein
MRACAAWMSASESDGAFGLLIGIAIFLIVAPAVLPTGYALGLVSVARGIEARLAVDSSLR